MRGIGELRYGGCVIATFSALCCEIHTTSNDTFAFAPKICRVVLTSRGPRSWTGRHSVGTNTWERLRVRIFDLGWANQSPILPAPELLSDKQQKSTQASSHQSHRLRPSAHLLRSHHDPVPVSAAIGSILAAHADGTFPLYHVVPRQRQVSDQYLFTFHH